MKQITDIIISVLVLLLCAISYIAIPILFLIFLARVVFS